MSKTKSIFVALLTLLAAGAAFAAGGDLGQVDKQPTNWVAISMFGGFVSSAVEQAKSLLGALR